MIDVVTIHITLTISEALEAFKFFNRLDDRVTNLEKELTDMGTRFDTLVQHIRDEKTQVDGELQKLRDEIVALQNAAAGGEVVSAADFDTAIALVDGIVTPEVGNVGTGPNPAPAPVSQPADPVNVGLPAATPPTP